MSETKSILDINRDAKKIFDSLPSKFIKPSENLAKGLKGGDIVHWNFLGLFCDSKAQKWQKSATEELKFARFGITVHNGEMSGNVNCSTTDFNRLLEQGECKVTLKARDYKTLKGRDIVILDFVEVYKESEIKPVEANVKPKRANFNSDDEFKEAMKVYNESKSLV